MSAIRSFPGASLVPCGCIAAAFVVLCGCLSEDPIVVEQVPSEMIGPAPVARPVERTDRMLAAIIPHGEAAIFFKVTGPEQPVAGLKDDFLELVTSVTFDSDEPRWTLPEGWTQSTGSGERLATISIPNEPSLETTVTSLPLWGDDTEFRLANVNRWRVQMGLRPIAEEHLHAGGDLDEETTAVSLEDGTKVTLVNISGEFSDGMSAPAGAGSSAASSTGRSGTSGLTYDVPDGWSDTGSQGIAVATLRVGELQTTITPLSAEANPLLPNIVRWRQQVGLDPIEEEQLDETLETVTLGDGDDGHFVRLIGPKSGDDSPAILGAIAYRGDVAWFVKMTGDSKDILNQQSNFKSFLASLQFPQDDR